MKNLLILCLLFFQVSCATKYVIPGNRFMTPETQGTGFMAGQQIEVQQTDAVEGTLHFDENSKMDGVSYTADTKTGFLFSNSLFERLDLLWSHTGSGNSMFGAKVQILGDTKATRTEGHKLAISGTFGSNEHETDDAAVEFRLSGKEYMLMYGYRFNEYSMLYSSFSHASYDFSGIINSSYAGLNGTRPESNTLARGIYAGGELNFSSLFIKVECGYQQLITTESPNFSHVVSGFAVGFGW